MPEIELAGGIHDGKRIRVTEVRDRFLMPVKPGAAISLLPPGTSPDGAVEPLVYERAGTRDDGTPWYRLR